MPAPGVLANDTDANGEPLTANLVSNVSNGTLTLNADGSFSYMPNGGYSGPESFTYRANDGSSNSNTVTVNIMVTATGNTAPVATGDSYSTPQDTLLTVNAPGILSNDTDADNDPLTAVPETNVLSGTLTFNGDGSFTCDPNAGFTGTDSFTYQADDSKDDSNTVTVIITVNQPPCTPTGVDLVVTSIIVNPSSPTVGQPATIEVTIKNPGSIDVTFGNNFFLDFYVDRVLTPGLAGDIDWGVQGGDLKAGFSKTFSSTWGFGIGGSHDLYAQVDTDDTVNECPDEDNNIFGPMSINVIGFSGSDATEVPPTVEGDTLTPSQPRSTPTPIALPEE